MSAGQIQDRIHITGDPGVVDRDDHPGPFGDSLLQQPFIQIHIVRADIRKYDTRPPLHERVGRGDERVGGHDHLIALAHPGEYRRHLQGVGAGCGQEGMANVKMLLHPLAALLGETSVAAEFAAFYCFLYVFFFGPRVRGYIKIDHVRYYNTLGRNGQK